MGDTLGGDMERGARVDRAPSSIAVGEARRGRRLEEAEGEVAGRGEKAPTTLT